MQKVVIVTNIPAPYRVDLFYYMQTQLAEQMDIHIVYTGESVDNRKWKNTPEKMLKSTILQSKVITRKLKNDVTYIHLPANISKTLSALNPDVVVAFEYNPAALQSLLWCKLHGKKMVHLTDGTLYSEREIGTVQRLSRKLITKQANACIASSTKAKEKLMAYGVPEHKIFISLLTGAFEANEAEKRNAVSGQILYVGSMVKRKGLDLLIQALPYVKSDWKLHIVGNGSEAEIAQLKQLAQHAGVSEGIVWRGYQESEALAQEYRQAKVFVLPTREDCFGLVLLEALAHGLPIISSQYADGAYDVISNAHEGCVVDPEDAQAMAEAIDRYLLLDESEIMAAGENLHRFTFESVAQGYQDAVAFVSK